MEGEDSAQVLVRFENGVVGSLVTSWAYSPSPNTERFSVVGSHGSLHAIGSSLHVRTLDRVTTTYEFQPVDEFAEEIRHFAEVLAEGRTPLHSHVEGVQTLELILAAYRSSRTGTIAAVAEH
jgi:predicted dehydrogenase